MRLSDSRTIKVLIPEGDIALRNAAIADQLMAMDLHKPVFVAVLKGSFMFAADLIRAVHRTGMAPQVEFIHLSSYRDGTVSSGTVEILRDVDGPVTGRDIVLIDDILESGRTLAYAKDLMAARGARRVIVCVLLEKPGKRAVSINPDIVGFTCDDVFVVGYGMDVAHEYRQLPFVGLIEKQD
jgi:hypoxanthine phosphoribosyltransferase